eukprot:TRINITY_DN854_c0_g1_i1.p1 TRINITY_DN854_c0_g1~~TRINITY_DN854_c0_g1_i1.p1  ORF type:complete len:2101 (-),score=576.24 TRINITY_DN854_c0_g1_i1:641-6916(-)
MLSLDGVEPVNETLKKYSVKYACVSACTDLVVFGANTGKLYFYQREPLAYLDVVALPKVLGVTTLKFFQQQQQAPRTLSQPAQPPRVLLAVASEKRTIFILECHFATQREKVSVLSKVTLHKTLCSPNARVCALEWDVTGDKLFSGDTEGNVVMTPTPNTGISFAKALLLGSQRIAPLGQRVVQLSAGINGLLLASDTTKTNLLDTVSEQIRTFGKRLWDGNHGSCFDQNDPAVVYLARPSQILSITDVKLCTFGRALSFSQYASFKVTLFNNAPSDTPLPQELNFGRLAVLLGRFLLSWGDDGLAVIRLSPLSIVGWYPELTEVADLAVYGNTVFAIYGPSKNVVKLCAAEPPAPEKVVVRRTTKKVVKKTAAPVKLADQTKATDESKTAEPTVEGKQHVEQPQPAAQVQPAADQPQLNPLVLTTEQLNPAELPKPQLAPTEQPKPQLASAEQLKTPAENSLPLPTVAAQAAVEQQPKHQPEFAELPTFTGKPVVVSKPANQPNLAETEPPLKLEVPVAAPQPKIAEQSKAEPEEQASVVGQAKPEEELTQTKAVGQPEPKQAEQSKPVEPKSQVQSTDIAIPEPVEQPKCKPVEQSNEQAEPEIQPEQIKPVEQLKSSEERKASKESNNAAHSEPVEQLKKSQAKAAEQPVPQSQMAEHPKPVEPPKQQEQPKPVLHGSVAQSTEQLKVAKQQQEAEPAEQPKVQVAEQKVERVEQLKPTPAEEQPKQQAKPAEQPKPAELPKPAGQPKPAEQQQPCQLHSQPAAQAKAVQQPEQEERPQSQPQPKPQQQPQPKQPQPAEKQVQKSQTKHVEQPKPAQLLTKTTDQPKFPQQLPKSAEQTNLQTQLDQQTPNEQLKPSIPRPQPNLAVHHKLTEQTKPAEQVMSQPVEPQLAEQPNPHAKPVEQPKPTEEKKPQAVADPLKSVVQQKTAQQLNLVEQRKPLEQLNPAAQPQPEDLPVEQPKLMERPKPTELLKPVEHPKATGQPPPANKAQLQAEPAQHAVLAQPQSVEKLKLSMAKPAEQMKPEHYPTEQAPQRKPEEPKPHAPSKTAEQIKPQAGHTENQQLKPAEQVQLLGKVEPLKQQTLSPAEQHTEQPETQTNRVEHSKAVEQLKPTELQPTLCAEPATQHKLAEQQANAAADQQHKPAEQSTPYAEPAERKSAEQTKLQHRPAALPKAEQHEANLEATLEVKLKAQPEIKPEVEPEAKLQSVSAAKPDAKHEVVKAAPAVAVVKLEPALPAAVVQEESQVTLHSKLEPTLSAAVVQEEEWQVPQHSTPSLESGSPPDHEARHKKGALHKKKAVGEVGEKQKRVRRRRVVEIAEPLVKPVGGAGPLLLPVRSMPQAATEVTVPIDRSESSSSSVSSPFVSSPEAAPVPVSVPPEHEAEQNAEHQHNECQEHAEHHTELQQKHAEQQAPEHAEQHAEQQHKHADQQEPEHEKLHAAKKVGKRMKSKPAVVMVEAPAHSSAFIQPEFDVARNEPTVAATAPAPAPASGSALFKQKALQVFNRGGDLLEGILPIQVQPLMKQSSHALPPPAAAAADTTPAGPDFGQLTDQAYGALFGAGAVTAGGPAAQVSVLERWLRALSDPDDPAVIAQPRQRLSALATACFQLQVSPAADIVWSESVACAFVERYCPLLDLGAVFATCERGHYNECEALLLRRLLAQQQQRLASASDFDASSYETSRLTCAYEVLCCVPQLFAMDAARAAQFCAARYPLVRPLHVKLIAGSEQRYVTYLFAVLDAAPIWGRDAAAATECFNHLLLACSPFAADHQAPRNLFEAQWPREDDLVRIASAHVSSAVVTACTTHRFAAGLLAAHLAHAVGGYSREEQQEAQQEALTLALENDDPRSFSRVMRGCARGALWTTALARLPSLSAITPAMVVELMSDAVGTAKTVDALLAAGASPARLPLGSLRALLCRGRIEEAAQRRLLRELLSDTTEYLWTTSAKLLSPQLRALLELETTAPDQLARLPLFAGAAGAPADANVNAAGGSAPGAAPTVSVEVFLPAGGCTPVFAEEASAAKWGVTFDVAGTCECCSLPLAENPEARVGATLHKKSHSVVVFQRCGHAYHKCCVGHDGCLLCLDERMAL